MKIKAPFMLEKYRRNKNGKTFLRILSAWGSVYRMTGLLTLGWAWHKPSNWTYFTKQGIVKL